jgi:hypothetical protein
MANERTRTPVAAEFDAAARRPAGTIREQRRAMRGLGRLAGALVLSVSAAACTTSGSDGFAPVYLEGADGGLRAHIVGRRDGGFYGESAAVGDIEPEGLLFIPAEQSPDGKALLAVTHEQTDSVTLIQLDPA